MNDTPTPPAPDDLVSRLHGVLAADPDTKVIDIRADDARALLARIETLTAEVDNRPSWQEWKDLLAAGYEQKARAEKAEAERDAAVAGKISEPCERGGFLGDIYYGHPIKTTLGTHRWNGSEWERLPSETEVLMQLLAKARADRDAAVEALRVIAGNSCITCSADAFNVLFAMKHPARIKEKRT